MSIFENNPEKIRMLKRLWEDKPWTRPRPVGLAASMGYGDRLGLATPGHIRAHVEAGLAGKVAPVFAQQSAREMERIGRSPVDVMWDACSAVGDSAFRDPHGADADHLKSEEQVHGCVEAGFTFFTADPSDLVVDGVDHWERERVESTFDSLVADGNGEFDQFLETYVGEHLVEGVASPIEGSLLDVQRTAITYGNALLRLREIHGWIAARWEGEFPFDFEASVDETATPTTPLAHWIIARELKRLGVHVTSLAPRFIGEFQKAIDYRGDLQAFEESFKVHLAIARQEGPYKVSVHSGSDKFSLYPILAKWGAREIHMKTSGTSYLEGLRVVARKAPGLFRDIVGFCAEVFEQQRASYHIDARIKDLPDLSQIADVNLEEAFFSIPKGDMRRQVLHVCFGAILSAEKGSRFGVPIKSLLAHASEAYSEALANHLKKHLIAFGQ